MIDLLSIYRDHCPFGVDAEEVKEYRAVYRAYCFGVYDALRSVAANLHDKQMIKDLEQMHADTVNEKF